MGGAVVSSPVLTQADLNAALAGKADASAVPSPAQAPPPGVTDSGAQGNIQRYAMENHTHASKARKGIQPISASGLFTWTFPTAFGSGVVPSCNALAICPAGTTALVNVQQEGDATNTQV